MYEIYHTDTKATAATVQTDPFQYSLTAEAGDGVRAALEHAEDVRQMNRTVSDEQASFEGQDAPIANTPTSMEGYQDPSDDFRLDRIDRAIRPAYRMREVTGEARAEARELMGATRYKSGDRVETEDGQRGVVVDVWTSGEQEGPDGETYQASEDSPVYVVAVEDASTGSIAVPASDLKATDWSTDVDDPQGELTEDAEAMLMATLKAADPSVDIVEQGVLTAGVTDFEYPDSWEESDIPARLILLDAWSSMGGQFDCGGGCCMGEMMSSGMSERAAAQFCASMKDRVLMWEGWR